MWSSFFAQKVATERDASADRDMRANANAFDGFPRCSKLRRTTASKSRASSYASAASRSLPSASIARAYCECSFGAESRDMIGFAAAKFFAPT
eukprot:29380-Pelagococcus_subviridis.AAC.15